MSDPENVSYHTINETVSSKSSTEEGNYNFYLTSKSSYTILIISNISKIFYSEILFIILI